MVVPSANLNDARNNFLASLNSLMNRSQGPNTGQQQFDNSFANWGNVNSAPAASFSDLAQYFTPLTDMPAAPTPQAPAAPPSAQDDTSGGMLNVGNSLLHALGLGMQAIQKPFDTLSVTGADLINGIDNLLNSHKVQNFDGTTSTLTPHPQVNYLQDLKNIWGNWSGDDKTAVNQWQETPMAQGLANFDPGHFGSHVGEGNNAGQLFNLAANLATPSEIFGLPLKAAREGIGMIPAVRSALEAPIAAKAGEAFDAAQAAKSAEGDPFASTAGEAMPAQGEPQIPQLPAETQSNLPVPQQSASDMLDSILNRQPDSSEPSILDALMSGQKETPAIAPNWLSTDVNNVVRGVGGNLLKETPTRNIVDADWTPIAEQVAKDAGQPASDVEDMLKSTFSSPNEMTSTLGSEDPVNAARDAYIKNVLSQSTPGDKLADALKSKYDDIIGKRVSAAMSKLGFGSGLDQMPEELRNLVLNNDAEMKNGNSLLQSHFEDLAGHAADAGLTKDDLDHALYQFETGQEITNPAAKQLIQELATTTNKGIDGVQAGLHAEMNAGMHTGNLRPNYIHLSLEPDGIFSSLLRKDKKSTITQGYNKEREFETAANARAAGYKTRDPISSTLDRLAESNRDLSRQRLYQSIHDLGTKQSGIWHESPTEGTTMFHSAVKGNPLNGKYLNNGLHKYLTELERVPVAAKEGIMGSLARGYDRMMNLWRGIELYNPLVHNHNTYGNAFLSYGLNPKNYINAERALKGSVGDSSIMDSLKWAEDTGALGNDAKGGLFKGINRILDGKNPNGNILERGQQAGLWNRERALRLGVFHQARMKALKQGLSEEQAANVARDVTNKYMVDYSTNNLSKFEKEFLSRVDPFYKWHKGNYALQFKNLASLPTMARIQKFNNTRNFANEMLSGHEQSQNIGNNNEKHTKIQYPIGGGNYASVDPYSPTDDVRKILSAPLGNFLWGRTARPIQEGILQALDKKYYPSAPFAPEGDGSMANVPMTDPMKGNPIGSHLQHAAGNFTPNWVQNLAGLIDSSAGTKMANTLFGQGSPKPNTVPPIDRLLVGSTGAFESPTAKSQQAEALTHLIQELQRRRQLRSEMIKNARNSIN